MGVHSGRVHVRVRLEVKFGVEENGIANDLEVLWVPRGDGIAILDQTFSEPRNRFLFGNAVPLPQIDRRREQ